MIDDADDEQPVWAITDGRGRDHFFAFRPDDIKSVEIGDRWIFTADFSSTLAFDLTPAPAPKRIWS